MATLKTIIVWLIVLMILGGAGYWGYRYWTGRQAAMAEMMGGGGMGAMGAGGGGPTPMPAATCVRQDVTDALEFTGTTEAVNAVEIRARVEGYLKGIHFIDGSLVEEGQLLFTIEPETYKSRRDEAAAMLKAGRTELERARLDFERIDKAVQTGSVSQQELTRARAAYETAQAQVMGYQAMLEKAELDLSYTEIRSPIAGRIGRRLVDIGNLVGAGDRTVLTTVMQTQPIYVFFHIGEHLLQGELLSRLQGGAGAAPLGFTVGSPNQDGYPYAGVVNYLDNTVDSRTGTVYVRGELPNAGLELLPGMFVRVRVPVAERKNAVLVPEKAISTDLGGKFLLVVGDGNVLERRDVKLGATIGALRVVTEGLTGEETFIVGGFHMTRPGMQIQPIPAGQMPPGAPQAAENTETTD